MPGSDAADNWSQDSWSQDLRWRLGALVFAVLLAVGAACVAWALHQLQASGERAARDDAHAMAHSVGQTLAQQLARAVRLGIPLRHLPGLSPYLAAALAEQPALVAIHVNDADGRRLAAAGTEDPPSGSEPIHIPIGTASAHAGTVTVVVDGIAATRAGLRRTALWAALILLALAAAIGSAAALGPGTRLERQRRLLLAALSGEALPEVSALASASGSQAALQALAQGEAALREQENALDAYAQELLAVDFDDQLRPAVQRVLRRAGLPAERD